MYTHYNKQFHTHIHVHKNGFTLIEIIVALSISTLILLAVTQTMLLGISKTRYIRQEETLHSNIMYMLNTIRHGVRNAEMLTPISSTEVVIRYSDYTTETLLFDGTHFTLDGEKLISDPVSVNDISLGVIDDSLRIYFELSSGTAHPAVFAATTTIAQRN